ncbi:MAG: short chain dehydrogenase [Chloroflexi bacterium]|nr:MAG: short chain dehydrogenase [Chloroflexota bacterium]MBL1195208.1 SDR family oxidoreductase [Chloroflexota bacterium]NOH12493.1 SDR family oxidoreductase [Chloroflexota bacterium]
MTEFKDKVVIITGASSGIGHELARQLAKQGAWLALAARREDKLEELAEECEALGGRALVVVTDVADEAQCKRLAEHTVEEFGGIDVLVNNAGITIWAKFEEMQSLDPFEAVMRVNYLGSLYCTHYALSHLKESQGRIVAVSSLAGKTGVPFRSGYSASKFAMAGFFETLRIEVAEHGVSVTMIYPDYVQTDTRLQAFGPDGKPIGTRPLRQGRMMTVEVAARQIIDAIRKRKRELLMSRRGKLGQWLKLIAPGLVDRIAARAVQGSG